jgi:hypothetical protein
MKKPIIKSLDKVVVMLLFILGVFSSCEKDEPKPEYGVAFMYGVPVPYNGENSAITQDIPVIGDIDLQEVNTL